jgi:hypothetical protein
MSRLSARRTSSTTSIAGASPAQRPAALRWFHAEAHGPPSTGGTPASANIVKHISPLTIAVPTLVMYPTADRWIRPASHVGLERYVPDLAFIE